MTAKTGKLSVVCPALNEIEVLPHFHRELCRVLTALTDVSDYEVVYIDDGSSDGTLSLLREWAESNARIRYVSLSRNFGHQMAFLAGIEHARGDALVLMDSDLQHPPALLPELVRSWGSGNDVVVTVRNEWRPRGLRRFTSRLFRRLWRCLVPGPSTADRSDYCLLSRRAADELLCLRETHRWLRGLIQWLGFATGEVVYTPSPRYRGQTKFTLSRLFGCGFEALVSFSRTPLRLSFVLGLVFVLFGLGVAGRALLGLIWPAWSMDSATAALLTSIHLVGGSVLCGLGLLGEYVVRIFEQVKGRPLYLVQETEETFRTGVSSRNSMSPLSAASRQPAFTEGYWDASITEAPGGEA